MNNPEKVIERLLTFLESEEISSFAEWCRMLEVPQSSTHEMIVTRNRLSWTVMTRIVERFPQLNIHWLISGRGPMLLDAGAIIVPVYDLSRHQSDCLHLNTCPCQQAHIYDITMTRERITARGMAGGDFFGLLMHGAALHPDIKSGDIVVINRRDTDLQDNHYYLLQWDGIITVRLVQMIPADDIALKTPGEPAKTITIPGSDLQHINNHGRVVYVIRPMPA